MWRWCLLLTGLLGSAFSQIDVMVNVKALRFTSYISHRFATTHVSSRLQNSAIETQEIGYEVQLPRAAFVTEFSMFVDGKVYPGVIKEKKMALQEYEEPKEGGVIAGHVITKSRTASVFRVSVNVAKWKDATFNLTYQELLERRLGYYEHVIYLYPCQFVNEMRIEVFMLEPSPITSVVVPPIRTDLIKSGDSPTVTNPLIVIDRPSTNSAYIRYKPEIDDQKKERDGGIDGQFVVRYDVQPDAGGDILVHNGYFVHFLAPKGLTPIPHDVLFVLDVSRNMAGNKTEQVKAAMLTILSDLHADDRFNIAEFSDRVKFWSEDFVPVANSSISVAKERVMKIVPEGGSDLHSALVKGMDFCLTNGNSNRPTLMIFMTSGHASNGTTNKPRIIDDTGKNYGHVALFGLAFGKGADYELIKSVSERNNGLAREIFDDSDAALQLTGFYDEVSTLLLSNVTIEYVGDDVKQESITKNRFLNYFNGSELVIAGQVTPNRVASMDLYITANKADGVFLQHETVTSSKNLTKQQLGFGEKIADIPRRIWAYLTIKQLLARIDATNDNMQISKLKSRALALSLQNSFVTPVTSMVVSRPNRRQVASVREWTIQSKPGRGEICNPKIPGHISDFYPTKVDGDPHFIVPLVGASHPVCFKVRGRDGAIFQLISDPERDIYVNAKVFQVNVTQLEKRHKSGTVLVTNKTVRVSREYINAITVMAPGVRLSLTNTRIALQYGRTSQSKLFRWRENSTITVGDVHISVVRQHAVTMEIGGDVILRVLKHRYRRQGLVFLGLYVHAGTGLSRRVGGLIGELRYKQIREIPVGKNEKTKRALLTVRDTSGYDHIAMVRLTHRMDLATKTRVPCWSLDPDKQRGIILDLPPRSYIVPALSTRRVRKRQDHVKSESTKSIEK